jgi:hypothetical protein
LIIGPELRLIYFLFRPLRATTSFKAVSRQFQGVRSLERGESRDLTP